MELIVSPDGTAGNSHTVPANEVLTQERDAPITGHDILAYSALDDMLTTGYLAGVPVPLLLNEHGPHIPTRAEFAAFYSKMEAFHATHTDQEIALLNERSRIACAALQEQLRAQRDAHERKSKASYVYLMWSDNLYKIGISIDPERRRKAVEEGLLKPVLLICQFFTDRAWKIERGLHQRFASKRIKGEWFDLTPEDVEYIRGLAS